MPDYAAALTGDLRGLRVGVPREYFVEGTQPGVDAAVREAIARAARRRREIVEISLPHTKYALPVYYIIAPAEASSNLARYDGVRYGLRVGDERPDWDCSWTKTRGAGFGPEVQAADHARHLRALGRLLRRLLLNGPAGAHADPARFRRRPSSSVDVIAAPTAPTVAFRIGEKTDDPLAMYLDDVFTLPAQPGRHAGAGGALRLQRGPAGRAAADRPALRRGHAAARRRRLPARDRLAYSPTCAVPETEIRD